MSFEDSPAPSISIKEVSKAYRTYTRPQDRLWQFFRGKYRKFFNEFWALHPVSFEVNAGECLGLVGRNGSGKSTLLQILAGTLTPSSGTFAVTGRISALLELGAGFNPEFTGRENAILNGVILGLSPARMSELMPAIEKFADIGEFMDKPVKTYSSGMYVRVAFAVAIHVEPQVLVVDEALAVGDAPFQYKCLRKIEELREGGMSLILVSHDVSAIRRFCNRAAWLHEGRLVSFGEVDEVVTQYEDFLREEIASMGGSISSDQQAEGHKEQEIVAVAENIDDELSEISEKHPSAKVASVRLLDATGRELSVIVHGGQLSVQIEYEVISPAPDGLVIGVAMYRNDGEYIFGINTFIDKVKLSGSIGTYRAILSYPSVTPFPGSYYLKAGIFDSSATVRWDFLHRAAEFRIAGPYSGEGYVLLEHQWEIESVRPERALANG